MDLSDIDLNLLVSLEILLQECNVTHAAQRLHISQPAMSAQLARLRTRFNDPLLLPAERGRGMTPTALGLTLAGPLSTALKGSESVVRFQASFDPNVDGRTFHVAASDDAMVALSLRIIEQLSSYPQIRIIFHRPRPEWIAADLERGTMDLLIDAERLIPLSMKARELSNGRFVMAQRPDHPRGTASLDLDTYRALQHVLFSSADGVPQGYMDEYAARHVIQYLQHRAGTVRTTLCRAKFPPDAGLAPTQSLRPGGRLVARFDRRASQGSGHHTQNQSLN